MMVEAGGTAKSFEYYAAGAPKVDEAVLASGLEACKVWIKESIALQRQLVASVIATHGPIAPMTYTAVSSTTADDVFDAVDGVATDGVAKADHDRRQGRAQRRHRRRRRRRPSQKLCGEGAEFAGREREVKEAVRSLTKKLVRKRIVDEGLRIDGRGLADLRPLVGRGRRAADGARHRPVPAWRDPGDERRHLAMPRMNQLIDTLSPETHKYFLFHYNMAAVGQR